MGTKKISFKAENSDGTTIELKEQYSDGVSWIAISYQFVKFLKGMGYHPSDESIEYDIEQYVAEKDFIEEGNW